MENAKRVENFKTQVDLAEIGLEYLYDKAIRFTNNRFPPLDPLPSEDENRLEEHIHQHKTIMGVMSYLLEIGFESG